MHLSSLLCAIYLINVELPLIDFKPIKVIFLNKFLYFDDIMCIDEVKYNKTQIN
jgi:hypothetical protein